MKQILFLLAVLITIGGHAQGSGRKSPHDTVSSKNTTVTYGRPYKKGRVVFGELEKYGKVWRVGADEATTIRFSADVKFGGADVKAGTYTLFAIPGETEWTLILNSKLGQWGAYSYEKNKEADIASVKVPAQQTGSPVEQLTIRFGAAGELIIEWDAVRVIVPII